MHESSRSFNIVELGIIFDHIFVSKKDKSFCFIFVFVFSRVFFFSFIFIFGSGMSKAMCDVLQYV